MADHKPFPASVQWLALGRQNFKCGSCGTMIHTPGKTGQSGHAFGESAEAHHIVPHSLGGGTNLENCVVLCRACHMSAHAGGAWADLSIYKDLKGLSVSAMTEKIAGQYPYYNGGRRRS